MTLPPPDSMLGKLMSQLPRNGRIEWIGLRPARAAAMVAVEEAMALPGKGLRGDRYAGSNGKRGVTLIQFEHLGVVATLSGHDRVPPALLRRNIVVSGLPLVALKGRQFRIGDVLLEGTDDCDPCSQMELALGPGGYNAMRGHGGLCARILEGGRFCVGDALVAVTGAAS